MDRSARGLREEKGVDNLMKVAKKIPMGRRVTESCKVDEGKARRRVFKALQVGEVEDSRGSNG